MVSVASGGMTKTQFLRTATPSLASRTGIGGSCAEQFDQQALVMGIEVLHQNKGHAGIGRRIGQERRERREAAGRGANAYDKAAGQDIAGLR